MPVHHSGCCLSSVARSELAPAPPRPSPSRVDETMTGRLALDSYCNAQLTCFYSACSDRIELTIRPMSINVSFMFQRAPAPLCPMTTFWCQYDDWNVRPPLPYHPGCAQLANDVPPLDQASGFWSTQVETMDVTIIVLAAESL